MKLCFVVGTRPEIIKLASLIKEAEKRKIDYIVIHSNQHYSDEMDKVFFQELNLPEPKYHLGIGSGTHGKQTGEMLIKIEEILVDEKVDVVFVQGDTNTVLAGGMAAAKLNIPVAHVEAGLRSYDNSMPEEKNRIMVDHVSDYLFAVTNVQRDILIRENISKEKIFVVGNTVVDTLKQIDSADESLFSELDVEKKNYFLVTFHRAENVDSKENLSLLLECLEHASSKFGKKVLWPIHPRAHKRIEEFGLKVPAEVKLLSPQKYSNFVNLMKNAAAVLTDSGGIQEETCALRIPCVTLRESTERPETVTVGANFICGLNKDLVAQSLENFFARENFNWENPFGEGITAIRILDIVTKTLSQPTNSLKINVYGMGYMGLPMASLLAQAGHEVTGVDIDEQKIALLKDGKLPFEENGLEQVALEVLGKKLIPDTKGSKDANIHIIAVPTPHKDKNCDLKYVISACESITEILNDGDLVILESTVKPGTCDQIIKPILEKTGKSYKLAYCPERAIPGQTLYELFYNDRIIGGNTSEASTLAREVYESFVRGQIFETNLKTAEVCKLLENTYRDVNIAVANEFDEVLKDLGVNTKEAIFLANRHPRVNILTPGIGVGGHCIAVDPWFLVEQSDNADLIVKAREINDNRPNIMVKNIEKELAKGGSKLGVLGLSYKANVPDLRESPAIEIVNKLLKNNVDLKCFDPLIDTNEKYNMTKTYEELEAWADKMVVLVNHNEFKNLDSKKFFEIL